MISHILIHQTPINSQNLNMVPKFQFMKPLQWYKIHITQRCCKLQHLFSDNNSIAQKSYKL